MVGGRGYILAGGGWRWVVVMDIFWLVVGGSGWWCAVMGSGIF